MTGDGDLVGKLCELHSRMLRNRYSRSWRPHRMEVSSLDADTVLKAAIELDRIRLRDSGSGPKGENSRSEVEGEAPQSGLSEAKASPNLRNHP